MRKVSRALAAAIIISAPLIGVSDVAPAAESRPTLTKASTVDGHPPISVTAADGKFYVWSDDAQRSYATAGHSIGWPEYVRNKADWVWNNGYVGGRDHVNIYWGWYYYGAYACISPGTSWNLRDEWQRFTWIRNGEDAGRWELVHDNAVSHRWVYYCGNDTF